MLPSVRNAAPFSSFLISGPINMVQLIAVAVGCTVGAIFVTVALVLLIAWCLGKLRSNRTTGYSQVPNAYTARADEFYVHKRSKFNTLKSKLMMKTAVKTKPIEKTRLRPQTVQPEAQALTMRPNMIAPHGIVRTMEPQIPVGTGKFPMGSPSPGESTAFDISYLTRMLDPEDGDGVNKPAGDNQKCGALKYILQYDYEQQKLQVKIVQAIDLLAKDVSGKSDPYVKASIVPSQRKLSLETKAKMKTLNPVWNETFHFEDFPIAKLETKSLVLKVLDYDRWSKDDPIGKVVIRLNEVDFTAGVLTYYRFLRSCEGDQNELGDILISLKYHSTDCQLSVSIKQCRNLKAKDIGGSSDPYVKIWMTDHGQQKEKRKTCIKMRTLSPNYNERFSYSVAPTKIKDIGFRFMVMDYDRFSKNDLIGELVLSTRSGPEEVKHWHEMLGKPRQEVERWHSLKELKK